MPSRHDLDPLAAHLAVIALAEAGPSQSDLAGAPVLDRWIPMLEFTGRVLLCGRVTGHPVLGDDHIHTSQLFGLGDGWARTFSRWYRLGTPLSAEGLEIHRGVLGLYSPMPDLDEVAGCLAAHAARVRHLAEENRRQ